MSRPRNRPATRRRTVRTVLVSTVLLAAIGFSGRLDAGNSDPALPRIKRISVKAGQPQSWPRGDWLPIDVRKFEALLESLKSPALRPPTAWIERTTYSATFSDKVLRGGILSADIRHSGDLPELLTLDPLNLAVSQLMWSDGREVIWGTATDGRTVLLVEPKDEKLSGRWNLTGRKLPRSVEFDFPVAPATVTRLQLRLPNGYTLSASAGEVLGPQTTDKDSGWRTWRVDLGSQSRCRLTIRRLQEPTRRQPFVLVESEISYVIREEGLQFQAEFNLEVLEAPINVLNVMIPAEIEVDAVTYGGEDSLAWRAISAGQQQHIAVQMPDPLRGRSRPIRILGIAPARLGIAWRLPRPALRSAALVEADFRNLPDAFFTNELLQMPQNTAFLDGQVHLKVETPIVVKSIETNGLFQTETVAVPDGAHSLTYHQFVPDAELTVQANYPDLALSSKILTHIAADNDSWLMTSQVEWTARIGITFQTHCLVSPEWEITDVRPSAHSETSAIANWGVSRRREGWPLLKVEFREGLSGPQPKSVVIVARRLPGTPHRLTSLPILKPNDHDGVEYVVAVTHPATTSLALDASSTFETTDDSRLPDFVGESPVWDQVRSFGNRQRLLLHSSGAEAKGALVVENAAPPFSARLWISHSLDQTQATEFVTAALQPHGSSISRVYIFFTVSGSDFTWALVGDGDRPLSARRVGPQRHREWNLPTTGELWEIHLPHAHHKEFQITGSRSRAVTARVVPSLAFVPAAQSFRGYIELLSDETMKLEIYAGPLSAVAADVVVTQRLSPLVRPRAVSRVWRYDSIEERLALQIRQHDPGTETQRVATLQLRSLIFTEQGASDVHWAELRVPKLDNSAQFHFQLPKSADLIGVTLNGARVSPARIGSDFVISPLPEDTTNQLKIQYRTPSTGGTLRSLRRIVVLQSSSHTILKFDWQFALPSGSRIVAEPGSVILAEPLRRLSWTERLFGPWGRPADSGLFLPNAGNFWRTLFGSNTTGTTQEHAEVSAPGGFPPIGWSISRATAPTLPQAITLEIWHAPQVQRLAWIGTLVCLLVGLSLKVLRGAAGERAGIICLILFPIAAWLAPPVYAEVLGGCFTGTVLAGLLPRRLLATLKSKPGGTDPRALGSTKSFRLGPATVLLLVTVSLTASSTGQEPTGEQTATSANTQTGDRSEDIEVLVPSDAGNQPDHRSPIVYVEKQALDRLKQLSLRRKQVDYLISSAEYRVRVDRQNSMTVEARYRIAVLPSAKSVRVVFPVGNVNPARCTVNDKPQPIVLSADGREFIVELVPLPAERSPNGVTLFDVRLELHPATVSVAGGGDYRLETLAVTSSRLLQEFAHPQPSVEVVGARGEFVKTPDGRSVTAELGKINRFRVLWSTNARPVQPPPKLEAQVTGLVDVRPTWLQLRYRVTYHVVRGKVDFVAWTLPPVPEKWVVREVTAKDVPVDFFISPLPDRRSRLLIEFAEPQNTDFVVDATFLLPRRWRDGKVQIPPVDLFEKGAEPDDVVVTLHQLGVLTSAEFQLSQLTDLDDRNDQDHRLRNATVESFLANLGDGLPIKTPRFAYDVLEPAELLLGLAPVTPHRQIRMIQTGTVRKRSLDWSMTAEIDMQTTKAAAFRHRLIVAPQLKVTHISVQEDDAERLVYWSRNGDRLDLFLSDKTTGIQNLSLSGSIPISLSSQAKLPLVRFDEALAADSKLRLYHEPELTVELLEADSLMPSREIEADHAAGNLELLGQYLLGDGDPVPQIRVRRRRNRHHVVTLTRLEGEPAGRRRVAIQLNVQSCDEPLRQVRILIPAELARSFELHAANAKYRSQRQPDGSVLAVVEPTGSETETLSLRVTATLSVHARGDWSVPVIEVRDAADSQHYLLLPVAEPIVPAEQSAYVISWSRLPGWARESASDGSDGTIPNVYRSTSKLWNFVRKPTGETAGHGRIPLVHTRIWLDRDAEEYGCTEVLTTSSLELGLVFAWPTGTQLLALFVDGETVAFRPPQSGSLTVPLDVNQRPHAVKVYWSRPADEPSWRPRSREFPYPRSVPVESSILSIVPPRGTWLTMPKRITEITPRSFAVERERVDTIMREVETLQTEIEPVSIEPGFAELMPASNREVLYGRLSAGEHAGIPSGSYWVIDKRITTAALALLSLLLVFPMSRKLARLQAGRWLNQHETVTWMLLGLLWWTCWRGSVFGMALLLLTGVAALWRRQRLSQSRETAAAAVDPSSKSVLTTGSN